MIEFEVIFPFGDESPGMTLAYESEEAQEHANSSRLALYA